VLLLLGLVYVGFRAFVLREAFDAVALPPYELHNMGNFATLLAAGGSHVPLWVHFDNAGGQQLVALLAAPLYATLGASYLVLKLVPLLLGLGALMMLWRIMRRDFGLVAAVVAGLLFAIGPPTLVKYSLLASGNHSENLVFWLAAWDLASRGHRRDLGRWHLVLVAAVAGLALFIYPGAIVPVALLVLMHVLVRGLRAALRDVPAAVLGALIGLSPLIAINVASGGRTLRFAGRNFAATGESTLDRLGQNAGHILGDLLPRAGCFEPLGPLPAGVAEALYLAGFLVAWLVVGALVLSGLRSLRATTDRPARWQALRAAPLVLYLPLFVLIIGLGRWDFDAYAPPLQVGQFRYFVPHFTIVAMLAGAAAQQLWDAGRKRRIAAAGLCAPLFAAVLWTLPIASPWPGAPDAGLRYEGHNFESYGPVLLAYAKRDPVTQAVQPDMQELSGWLAGAPPRDALETWSGIAYAVAQSRSMTRAETSAKLASAVDMSALAAGQPPAVQIALARGLGSALRPLARGDELSKELLQRLLLLVEKSGTPLAGWVTEGLCLEHEFTLSRNVPEHLLGSLAVLDALGPERQAAARHGYGAQLGRLLARGIDPDVHFVKTALARLPSDALHDVARGLGWGACEVAGAEGSASIIEGALPEGARLDAFTGAGAARRWIDGAASAPAAWSPAAREAFDRGVAWPNFPAPWWQS
jgi:Dolichyl-phosphate-mannose-protein mannosyltransferase